MVYVHMHGISAAGLEFFDKVSGALEEDTAQVRAGRCAALRGVTAALVRQQGYKLAQIVTEMVDVGLRRWLLRAAMTMMMCLGMSTTTALMTPI
jgi:hypothetical protein